MARLRLIYSTTDGHTLEICKRLKGIAESEGHEVAVEELAPGAALDPDSFDVVVVGASIRYGKHKPEVARFIEEHREILESRPSAFFSVNAVARKPEKKTPETNPYVRKFLQSITWKPEVIGIFAGRIDYPRYGFIDRTMIRFIMWMTKGPTDPTGTFEFTEWDEVDDFGRRIAGMLATGG